MRIAGEGVGTAGQHRTMYAEVDVGIDIQTWPPGSLQIRDDPRGISPTARTSKPTSRAHWALNRLARAVP
jgi:hypothetical protein